jgi:ribosomal protein L40E
MSFENILQYKLCIKCNSDIAKIGTNYCKKCQVKPIKTSKKVAKKSTNNKIYYYKFQNRDTKARLLLKSSELNIGILYLYKLFKSYQFIL